MVTMNGAMVTMNGAMVTMDGAMVTMDGAMVTMDGAFVMFPGTMEHKGQPSPLVGKTSSPRRYVPRGYKEVCS